VYCNSKESNQAAVMSVLVREMLMAGLLHFTTRNPKGGEATTINMRTKVQYDISRHLDREMAFKRCKIDIECMQKSIRQKM